MESKTCKCGNYCSQDEIFCFTCKTRMTSVIVQVGDNAVYIPSKEWEEREKYRELKKKWDWLD